MRCSSLVCLHAEGLGSAVLDFNNTVGALLLVQDTQLTLRNLQLMRLAPATAGYTSGSYVSMTSLLWPSVNAAPGCKVLHFMPRNAVLPIDCGLVPLACRVKLEVDAGDNGLLASAACMLCADVSLCSDVAASRD